MPGHPWHPAIVHFPVACWVLATLIDVAGRLVSMPPIPGIDWTGLSHLLLWTGVVLALPAMLAGLIDYSRLPGAVQESADLVWHIALMGTAWALFLWAAIWRVRTGPFDGAAQWSVTIIEVAGSGCLVAGGYFAATVVFERLPEARE